MRTDTEKIGRGRRRSAGRRCIVSIGAYGIILLTALQPSAAMAEPRHTVTVTGDIPYADASGYDMKLTSLDIYRPSARGDYPVLIFVHGGAWRMGDKKYHRDIGNFFAGEGYVTVAINYRLSPDVIHPAHVADVARAVSWIVENIEDYGGDPLNLFIMGHSAGAHLTALVTTDERYLAEHGLGMNAIRGAIPIDGAGFDIPELMRDHERVYGRMYRTAFGDDPNKWADASPINHIGRGKNIPPFLVIWAGTREAARSQTRRFADVLKGAGIVVETYHAQDKNHGSVLRGIGTPGDETTEHILSFMKGRGVPVVQ